jgi:hypothetical protein
MNLFKIRRSLYRTASILGDAQAVNKSIRTRSVKPAAKRVVRKEVYKAEGRATRAIFRQIGL